VTHSSDAAAAVTAVLAAATDRDDGVSDQLSLALARLGLDADDGRVVTEAVLRSRREQTRLRRREHELAELLSSARELAELRDDTALLTRVVERARAMTNCDVAYLSEFDEESRTLRVRTTSGSVSPAFRELTVPAGRGLASEVVESRAPQWVARYREYSEERHEGAIDDAVDAEGLVSLLGVPMLSDEGVLGVLFVANRAEVHFPPEQIAVLSALADHASAALQTAQAMRSLRRSDGEAREAVARLTSTLDERDRANTVHQELVQAVLEGGGFAPVAQTLSSALQRPVVVIDEGGRTITASGDLPEDLGGPIAAAIDESRASGHCDAVHGVDGVEAVAALTAGAQYFGAMILGTSGARLSPVDNRTVERAAQVGALLALQRQAVVDAERRLQSELVADVLSSRPERHGDAALRAQRIGITLSELDTVVVFSLAGEHRAPAARALATHLGDRALVGEHRGFVVALVDGNDSSPDIAALYELVAAAVPGPVLAVLPPADGTPVAESFAVAARTTRLLAALDVHSGPVLGADYLPYSVVFGNDTAALRAFVDGSIGAVRAYDRERGAELLATLRVFVRSGGSATRAARVLNFHPNTIVQRLDRLDSILGAGWRDEERLFRIGMAVRLDEMRERLHPQ
jgi:DNA-binding PucR family transcriptional regulator